MAPLQWDNVAQILSDSYEGDDYKPLPIVTEHEKYYRFGYTKDFAGLIGGTSENTKDYITGIIIGSIVVLCVFIIWSIVLLILRCLGWNRVGFFAGVIRSPKRPSLSSAQDLAMYEDNDDNGTNPDEEFNEGEVNKQQEEYEEKMRKFNRKLKWIRIVFLLAALLVIIASVLFYSEGIGNLINSINSVQDTSKLIRDVILRGESAAEAFVVDSREEYDTVTQRVDDPNNSLAEWCPNNAQLNGTIEQMENLVKEANEGAAKQASVLLDDFSEMLQFQEDLDDSLESVKPVLYTALSLTIVTNILVIILVICVIVAWMDIDKRTKCRRYLLCMLKCMRNAVALPLFILLMVLSWIIASLFLVASVANSDFCVDPDKVALKFLQQHEEDLNSILYDATAYYVSGCKSEYYTESLETYDEAMTGVTVGTVVVHKEVGEALSVDWDNVADTCSSTFNPSAMRSVLDEFDLTTHNIFNLVEALQDILQCPTISAIYQKAVHQAICVDAVGGFVWIYTSALIIAICSMIMVTLRVAYYEIPEEDEEFDEGGIEVEKAVVDENVDNVGFSDKFDSFSDQ